MIPQLHQHRSWLAPLLTFVVMVIMLAAILLPLNAKQAKYEQTIKTAQPRIERVQGLIQAAPMLDERLNAARASAQAQFYPANVDENRLNTELQTRLRNLAQHHGLTIGSLRGMPPRKEHNLDIFLLNLNLQGGMAELQKFIHTLDHPSDGSPVLRVDNLILRRASLIPNTPQMLSIDITVAALRPASTQTATP